MHLFFTIIVLILPYSFAAPDRHLESSVKIPDHSLWTEILTKYVNEDGLVDYASWLNDQDLLDQYLHQLSGPLELSHWSQNVQLSYWINIHNAYTIKLVLENYPTNQLCDSLNDQWMQKQWIKLDTTMYSLSQIQHEIRHQFHDARAHFALNFATKSSAPLRNEAYIPHQLNSQLEDQTILFINNPSSNQVNDSTLVLSPIFSWYETDFRPSVLNFFNTYHQDTVFHEKEIQYTSFNWTLNDQENK